MVYTKPGVVEILDVERPRAAEGEVIVDVAACGICGSELHGISSPGFRKPPLIMGHEFSGVTGDGRRVTVNPVLSCGACDMCLQKRDQLCRERSIIGIHRPGGFAEQVAVPETALHDLPDGVSLERGALIEPLANAVHAWALASPPPTARVGIIGAGTIGLMVQLVAKLSGADVSIVDLAAARLELAHGLGADWTGSELSGEFDVVFDAVGASATRRATLEHVKPGATAVWLGLLQPDPGFDALNLIRFEKTVAGAFAYTRADFERALTLAGKIDLDWTTRVPLDDGATIFDELANGRCDIVKTLLNPAPTAG